MSRPVGHDYGYTQRNYLVPIPKAWVVGENKRSFRRRKRTFAGIACVLSGFFTVTDMLLNPDAGCVCWNWSGIGAAAVGILYTY
jgi:hypothetical protein